MQEIQKIWVWSLGQEDSLEEGMAMLTSILAWRIPWKEEPGGLCSMGSQRVRHSWSEWAYTHTHTLTRVSHIFSIYNPLVGLTVSSPTLSLYPNSITSTEHNAWHTFSSVHLLSRSWLFVTPWTEANQASLSITNHFSILALRTTRTVWHTLNVYKCLWNKWMGMIITTFIKECFWYNWYQMSDRKQVKINSKSLHLH